MKSKHTHNELDMSVTKLLTLAPVVKMPVTKMIIVSSAQDFPF